VVIVTAAAAKARTLRRPAVTAAIVGVRTPQQVQGIIGAADLTLGPREISEIEDALKLEGVLAGGVRA